jgi:hypothetical protein
MIKNRIVLKDLLKDGEVLEAENLAYLIDSYLHLTDDGSTKIKELLSTDKLTSNHINITELISQLTTKVGAGINIGDLGFTSNQTISIHQGTIVEFEAYVSTLKEVSKVLWAIFDEAGDMTLKTGSNINYEFTASGDYTFSINVYNDSGNLIGSKLISNWVTVLTGGGGAVPLISQVEVEYGGTLEDMSGIEVVQGIISGTDITVSIPTGISLTKIRPRIISNGILDGIKNGVPTDMSGVINFNVISLSDSEQITPYTLTVTADG